MANLYADQNKYAEAIPEYLKARELGPDLSDVRYRLGQAYMRTGEKEKAQAELEVYQRLREQHLAEVDKQRADIRQFVYGGKGCAHRETMSWHSLLTVCRRQQRAGR